MNFDCAPVVTAIRPKITRDEFAASCRRCVPLRAMDDATLSGIYSRIAAEPLQIYHGRPGVATAVRASQHGDDRETAAVYSTYSSLRAPAAHTLASGGGGGGGGGAAAQGMHAAAAAASSARSREPQIQIDWAVAYWNLVDMTRYARAASWRWMSASRSSWPAERIPRRR